jgi:tRNA threonylcarbamoyladenosine biosynthesis protein TsaE
MSVASSPTWHLPDEAATLLLARQLAAIVSGQANPTLPRGGHIHLSGDLGTGKTTFVRAFLRSSGVEGRIKSPTYALLESYKTFNLYFYHFDFYRFSDPREWIDAGFRDLIYNSCDPVVVLIEWPERAIDLLPLPDLHISLAYADQGRYATLTAPTAKGQLWLNTLLPLQRP